MGKLTKNRFASSTTERETPQWLFDKLNEEFEFTLDPCATSENTKCEKFYTSEQDGLKQSWSNEVVYVNPPYGREVPKWLKKGIRECDNDTTSVFLIPARTNTHWFHELVIEQAHELRFIRGRPKFGDMKYGLPFPLVIVVYYPWDRDRYPKVKSFRSSR